MIQPTILTDLDNTLYSWVDFFAPSFRGMLHALSYATGIDEEIIMDDFKSVYKERGSLEYSFSVQELKMCRSLSVKEVERLVFIARGAFSRVRQKHLKPYGGVRETLKWAVKEGIKVIGVTNSPLFHAKSRLRQLRLDGLFFGLAGWEGYDIPDDYPGTNDIKKHVAEGKYTSKVKKTWPLSKIELKPSPTGYLKILNQLGISHKVAYVIGDSLQKDVAPALEIGAIGIWAKYGLDFDEKNFQTLLRITNWSPEEVSAVYDKESVTPTYVINSFSELQRIVQPPQLKLEGFS